MALFFVFWLFFSLFLRISRRGLLFVSFRRSIGLPVLGVLINGRGLLA